jgi:hypothetical protein
MRISKKNPIKIHARISRLQIAINQLAICTCKLVDDFGEANLTNKDTMVSELKIEYLLGLLGGNLCLAEETCEKILEITRYEIQERMEKARAWNNILTKEGK